MKKLQLKIAVLGSVIAAGLHRLCNPEAIALGNTNPPAAAPAVSDATAELARRDAREKAIKERIARSGGALTREQAESAHDHQLAFDAKKAAASKKEAAKK